MHLFAMNVWVMVTHNSPPFAQNVDFESVKLSYREVATKLQIVDVKMNTFETQGSWHFSAAMHLHPAQQRSKRDYGALPLSCGLHEQP